MAPPPTPSSSSAELRATYKSSNGNKAFSYDITTETALGQVSEKKEHAQFSKVKTAYLSELRPLVKEMQREINVFLTAKMEEDKNSTGDGVQTKGKGKDEVEEENYGEEDVEEE